MRRLTWVYERGEEGGHALADAGGADASTASPRARAAASSAGRSSGATPTTRNRAVGADCRTRAAAARNTGVPFTSRRPPTIPTSGASLAIPSSRRTGSPESARSKSAKSTKLWMTRTAGDGMS
jgi:hypothetical protein